MSWEQGSDAIELLLGRGELERVAPAPEYAEVILDEARRHLASAAVVLDVDPSGGYGLAYDAARKALVALLQAQGLRATSRGGHIAVLDAAVAQLVPPMGETLRPQFGRMRRRRHQAEYPSAAHPAVSSAEVRADLRTASAIVEMAERLVPELPPYR